MSGPDFERVLAEHRLREFDQPTACICGWDWGPRASWEAPGRTEQHRAHVAAELSAEFERWFKVWRADDDLEYRAEMERLDS